MKKEPRHWKINIFLPRLISYANLYKLLINISSKEDRLLNQLKYLTNWYIKASKDNPTILDWQLSEASILVINNRIGKEP